MIEWKEPTKYYMDSVCNRFRIGKFKMTKPNRWVYVPYLLNGRKTHPLRAPVLTLQEAQEICETSIIE